LGLPQSNAAAEDNKEKINQLASNPSYSTLVVPVKCWAQTTFTPTFIIPPY